MDLAQGFQQIWQNLQALGTRRLIALGLVGVTLFSAIALGSYLVAKSDYQPLYVGLSTQDSSRMAAALTELGIPYEVSPDATKVLVPASAVARARGVLAERNLPASADAGYELFDKIGPLGLTTFIQEVTRVRALEGEITRTLASMSGIVAARVHLVLGDRSTLRTASQVPTASVVLRLGVAPERAPVEAVRNVVAAAVPGLSLENVRVVSSDGAVLAAGGEGQRPGAGKMFDLEKTFSAQLKSNLSAALEPMLGYSNFQSSIAVRLNADQSTINESIYDPESKVERSVRVVKEAGNSKDGSSEQAVGVGSNVPQSDAAGSQSQAQNQKSNQRRDEIINYEINSKNISTTRDGYRVENISVALVVNKSVLKQADGKPLDDQALASKIAEIEKLAASAVGLDPNRGDRVTVVAQDFLVDELDSTNLDAEGLGVVLQNSSSSIVTAVVMVLALLAIVWLGIRPLMRVFLEPPSRRREELALTAGGGASGVVGEPQYEMATAPIVSNAMGFAVGRGGQEGSAAPLVARLNELISRDPDQAVAVFRRWVNADEAR